MGFLSYLIIFLPSDKESVSQAFMIGFYLSKIGFFDLMWDYILKILISSFLFYQTPNDIISTLVS